MPITNRKSDIKLIIFYFMKQYVANLNNKLRL